MEGRCLPCPWPAGHYGDTDDGVDDDRPPADKGRGKQRSYREGGRYRR